MVAQIDSGYRTYGARKSLRRFTSYLLFEGRPHTTKGQWFNPVVFCLLRILRHFPGSPELNQPVFITGLGRSGTTILGVLLSLHKDVGFLNEPKAIWKTVDPRHDVNGDYTKSGGIYKLGQDDVTASSRQGLQRIFCRYLTIVRASRLVDKYPELIFRIDYLLQSFENPRIIFISRCGVDAVHSIELWSQRLGTQHQGNVEDWWGRNDIKWHYLRKQILLHDPQYRSVSAFATDDLDHINRAALEWTVTMREGLRCLEKHPDKIHHIAYECLIENPEHELRGIFNHCNLANDTSVLNYAKSTLYKNASKPWPKLLPSIESIFVETMKRLGYDPSIYERE